MTPKDNSDIALVPYNLILRKESLQSLTINMKILRCILYRKLSMSYVSYFIYYCEILCLKEYYLSLVYRL